MEKDLINIQSARLVMQARANMQNGQLEITNNYKNNNGDLFYEGMYIPHSAFNPIGTSFRDFALGQDYIIRQHLEFYIDEFNEGINAQIKPVELAPTTEGQIGIIDGHHRVAAGIFLGKPIPVLIHADTEPVSATHWSNIRLIEAPSPSLKSNSSSPINSPSHSARSMRLFYP